MFTVERERLLTTVGLSPEAKVTLAKPRIFAELLRQAYHSGMAYASDFYHDAKWIEENIKTLPSTFHFAYNENGTQIGPNLASLTNHYDVVLEITVEDDEGIIYMTVDKL